MKRIALLLLSPLLAPSLHAADWSWQPALEWRMDSQTNRLLISKDATATQGAWLSLDTLLKRATESLELSLRPHIEAQRFANDAALDAENRSLQFYGRWLREYSQFTATADVQRASTLVTELAETGIVDASTRRDARDASLMWAQTITPQLELDTQVAVSDIDYPNGLRAGLVSYRYDSASLSLVQRLSDYTSWNLAAFGGKLEAPLTLTTSRDLGLRAGLTRVLSPVMQLELSAGLTDTRLDNFFESRSDRSQVWDAKLTRATELGQLSLSFDRNIVPNGRGLLARRDELVFGIRRALSANFSTSLSLQGVRNVDGGSRALNTGDDYRYLSGEAALTRLFPRSWTVSMRLGVKNAERPAADSDAHGWYVALALDWAPPANMIRYWELP